MDFDITYSGDGPQQGLLYSFETRKTLIGFRLKVQFQSQHVCIYVDAAKYKTAGDLCKEICRRNNWQIEEEERLRILVDGKFEVPQGEPVVVLAGVGSVLITLEQLSRTDAHFLERCSENDEHFMKVNGFHSHSRGVGRLLKNLRETSADSSVDCVRMTNIRKRSRTEPSESEFTEEPDNPRENYSSLANESNIMDCDKKSEHTSPAQESRTVENEEQTEQCEYFPPKKRTRRKRKHSKKNKKHMDTDVVDGSVAPASVPKYPPPMGTGKHKFFRDDEDLEVLASVIREHVEDTVPESRTSSAFYVSQLPSDAVSQIYTEHSKSFSDADDAVASPPQQNRIKKSNVSCANVSRTDDDQFYYHPSSENGKNLGTLLMYKDMRTSGSYDIEYSSPSPKKESLDDTNINSYPDSEIDDEMCETIDSSEVANGSVGNKSSDCEVTFQSKIIDGCIHFKCSNQWRPLTEKSLVDKNFVSIEEPKVDQTIVFQFWYLTSVGHPSLSELIVGRVMEYNSTEKKVVMEIAPALMEHMLSVNEDGETLLPEGVNRTSRRAFELDWTSVTNPRLLS